MYVANEEKGTSLTTTTFIVRWDHSLGDRAELVAAIGGDLSDVDGAVAVVARSATDDEEAEAAWAHDQLLAHLLHSDDGEQR